MLCGHAVPFSETWPTSGMTRGGRLYPLPMREPPHRRERVFILAWPAADAGCRELQRRGVARVLGSAEAGEPGEGDQRERAGDAAGDSGAAAAADAAGVRLPLRQPEHLGRGSRAAAAPDGRDTAEHDGIAYQGSTAAEDADRAVGSERREAAPGQAAARWPWPDAGRSGGASKKQYYRRGPTDGTHGGPNQRGSSGDLMLPSAVIGLLPTPRASDTGKHRVAAGERGIPGRHCLRCSCLRLWRRTGSG